jgi:hypothetical protein
LPTFCFFHPAQALWNSILQLLACVAAPSRSLAQAICGWTLPPGPPVSTGDDVFLADEFGERDDAIGYQFRVLDRVGGVAGQQPESGSSRRKFHVALDFVFMFMSDVAGFDQVRLGIDTEHDIDDVAQRKIGGVRTVPATPADVIAHRSTGMPSRA